MDGESASKPQQPAPGIPVWIPVLLAWAVVRQIQVSIASGGFGNDVVEYFGYARAWVEGKAPYVDFQVEYPPGALLLFLLPLLVGGRERYVKSFVTQMAVFDLLALLLVLVWNRLLERLPGWRSWALLLLAAFFPGTIYAQAVFPISTVLLLILVFLLAVRGGRPVLAAAAGVGAAFTYPTGCLLAPVYGVWLLGSAQASRGDWRRLLPMVGPALGLGAVLALMAAQTGVWDAFFRNQVQGFGYGLSDPLGTLMSRLVPLFAWRSAGGALVAAACQTVLVLFIVGWAGAEAIRSRSEPVTALFGLTLATYWLFPLLVGGQLSLYRSEALLLPAVWLLRRAPAVVLGVILVAAVVLAIPMARGFFQGALV